MSRSTVDRLPTDLRDRLNAAIAGGRTIDELVELVEAAGFEISRSAAGRYSKRYAQLAARQRDISSVATAFAKDFGSVDDHQGRLMIQLFTSIATTHLMKVADGDDDGEAGAMDGQELHFLARAVKDVTSAAKIDIDREAKIREEAVKTTKREAAEAAERSMKAGGASSADIKRVRAEILGIAA